MPVTPSEDSFAQLLSSYASLAGKASNVSDRIGLIIARSGSQELKEQILPLLNELNRTIEWATSEVQSALPEGLND